MYSPKKSNIKAQTKISNCLRIFFGLEEVPATDFNKSRLKSVSYAFGTRISMKKIILTQSTLVKIII